MKVTTFLSTVWPLLLLPAALSAPSIAVGQSTTRQWQLVPDAAGEGCRLVLREVPTPQAGPGEVQVRIRATSLNGRDRYGIQGCPRSGPGPVPLSDGAGEVIAVGPGVTRFAVGDRVVGTFFGGADYLEGDRPRTAMAFRRAGPGPGMLSEIVVDSEHGFVRVPSHLSYEEASTLTTAGVTAFTSLFKHGDLQPNEFVLLEGTGGVSSFGLLIAAAAGARPIITSSSDEKLARARELGAWGTVNYRRYPEWHEEVLRLTDGLGVQHVIEIGGRGTLERALQSLGNGGHIALIGGLEGGFAESIPVGPLFARDGSVTSFHVGSRVDFEALNRFLEGHGIHPVIDRVFEFEDAPAAFDFFNNGDFMGKIVIRL